MKGKRDTPKPEDVELRPDGWERFERAVDVAVKTPARHREKNDPVSRQQADQSPGYRVPGTEGRRPPGGHKRKRAGSSIA